MQNNEVGINTNTFEHDLDEFENRYNTIQDRLHMIISDMNDLNKMWTGAANAEYVKQFEHDQNYLEEIFGFLANYLDACEHAKKEYVRNENEIHDVINAIKI